MALPQIPVRVFETTLPVLKKKIKFRPFNAKEQSLLVEATEDGDKPNLQTVASVLQACILTDGVQVLDLTTGDIEWLFLQLRIRSAGEVVEFDYQCKNKVKNKDCNAPVHIELDLTKLQEPLCDIPRQKTFPLGDMEITLRLPTLEVVADNIEKADTFSILADCLITINTKEHVYAAADESKEDLIAWIGEVPNDLLLQIKEYFESVPRISLTHKAKCSKCGYEHSLKFEGIEDFFGLGSLTKT